MKSGIWVVTVFSAEMAMVRRKDGSALARSAQESGDWASFVGMDKEETIRIAKEASSKWVVGYELLVSEVSETAGKTEFKPAEEYSVFTMSEIRRRANEREDIRLAEWEIENHKRQRAYEDRTMDRLMVEHKGPFRMPTLMPAPDSPHPPEEFLGSAKGLRHDPNIF